MGDKVVSLVDNNAALLGEAQKLTPEQRTKMQGKYKARDRGVRANMVDGLVRCRPNAKVKAAMEKIDASAPSAVDEEVLHDERL